MNSKKGIEDTIIQYLELDESWTSETRLLVKEWIRTFTQGANNKPVMKELEKVIKFIDRDLQTDDGKDGAEKNNQQDEEGENK